MASHPRLLKQLGELGPPDGWSPELRAFVDEVERCYREADAERDSLEKALELGSRELLQANAEMRDLFEAFPDLFFCVRSDGSILHCNAGRRAELQSSTVLGRRIQDLLPQDERPRFETAMQALARQKAAVSFEYSSGGDASAASHYELRLLPLETPGQAGVFVRDITARKHTELALRLTQFAIERVGEAAFWTDPDGRLIYVNETACACLERTREELLGMSLFDVETRWRREQWPARWAELKRRRHFTVETTLRAKSGRCVPVEISMNHVEFDGREYNCCFARDVSERRQMELAARHADKMSAVGQLAAGVAHEINNPLGVILGFAQSLRHRLKEADPLELPIRSIEREALRCRNLVSTLLGFSRERRRDASGPDDPLTVLGEALALVESQAKMLKGIRIVRDAPARLPMVFMNGGQIQQVLINLCTNAMDAMPDGGDVVVAMRVEDEELIIRVADSGLGIPRQLRQRIFDPFFTTKPVGKGTGLGLSLVYEIVRSHNGRIDVESEPGRGSVFTVRIPAAPLQTGARVLSSP